MARMGIWGRAWLLLALLLLFPGAMMASDPITVTATRAQNGKDIGLKVGSILEIELTEIGGTGFLWFEQGTSAPYLKLIEQTTRPDKEGRLGGPVLHVWRFKAEKPGATLVKMAYYRPWEGAQTSRALFLVKIHIE